MPHSYIWPLSKSIRPDAMNTSFGPRINRNKWDFHDGIDLPAPIGTPVFAMRGGTVFRAGPGGTDQFTSRHVVLRVTDPEDGATLFLVYVHLDSIADGIVRGVTVAQGQLLGSVGEDGAEYPHLHFEFRKGHSSEEHSMHPLHYLPYPDRVNFTAPVEDRFNRTGELMAARLLFGAPNRLQGDLKRIEVELRQGANKLATRVVDFDDKSTINEGNGDDKLYVNDIGVEGYQKSPMAARGRSDLQYGILIRKIPRECDRMVAAVTDVRGNTVRSSEIAIARQNELDLSVNFESGNMPPDGWRTVVSDLGAVENAPAKGVDGSRGMECTVAPSTDRETSVAAIEHDVPRGRFQWMAEGRFYPSELNLHPGQTVHLMRFAAEPCFVVAAHIWNGGHSGLRAGITVRLEDGTVRATNSSENILPGVWRKWRLRVRRIATREATAVLYLNGEEELRVNWDASGREPRLALFGIAWLSAGADAMIAVDELRLTESG